MKVALWNCLGAGAVGACVMFTGVAHAQISGDDETELTDEDAVPMESEPMEEAPPEEPAAAPEAPFESAEENASYAPDGPRFRFGISGGAGPLIADGVSFTYGGADARFGVQINDLIGVYAQPQLGIYAGGNGAVSGIGGLIGASAGADFTFVDRFFVGAGVGYAILNSPSGAELHFRLGGYPLMSKSVEKARRKGLMVGVDFRLHFVEGYTFVAPTFAIGYEAF